MLPEGDEVILAEAMHSFLRDISTRSVFVPPRENEWLPLSATAPHMT
jgi:hypothetical protein